MTGKHDKARMAQTVTLLTDIVTGTLKKLDLCSACARQNIALQLLGEAMEVAGIPKSEIRNRLTVIYQVLHGEFEVEYENEQPQRRSSGFVH